MSDTPTLSADQPLRIVLFGMPAAGKSALLGALVQSAETQPQLLGGQMADPSGGLHDLRKQTYDQKLAETQQDVVPLDLVLQTTADTATRTATLFDCAGRVAQEYLSGQRTLEEAAPLTQALHEADALLLVVDAAAGPAQLDQTFKICIDFLRLLEKERGRRTEIAGLPVYLVLAKCDLLARKEDTQALWLQRMEEGKRKINKRLQEALRAESSGEPLPFGAVDLHVWATAVRRPPLADRPARPQEPYGVAELFRQVLDSARAYHGSRTQSGRRLRNAVVGLLAVLAVMGLVAGAFFAGRPSPEVAALEKSIRQVLPGRTAPASERLRGNLEDKLKQLAKVQQEPEFAQLPTEMQEEVREAVREIEVYQKHLHKVSELGLVHHLKSEKEIEQKETLLAALEFPAEYAQSWAGTALGHKLKKYREDLTNLRAAALAQKEWFEARGTEGEKLRKNFPGFARPDEAKKWDEQVEEFLARKEPKETQSLEKLPAMTYGRLYQFPTVRAAREQWKETRGKLENLRRALQ